MLTKIHTLYLKGLLSGTLLLSLCAVAGDHINYTFQGTLKQDRNCSFNGASSQTIDFSNVEFKDDGTGKKVLVPQTPQLLSGLGLTCTPGIRSVFLTFDTAGVGVVKDTANYIVLKVAGVGGAGIGIGLFKNGTAQDFDEEILVLHPEQPLPAMAVQVVQTESDGHSLTPGAFSTTATLKLSYP